MTGYQVNANNQPRTQSACAYFYQLTVAFLMVTMLSAIFGGEAAKASDVAFWQNPVVTHTNGVRLASTTPLRSHNMYWQCDPDHRGYCNGRMNRPACDDLAETTKVLGRGYRLPYGPRPKSVSNHAYHGAGYHDGFEAIEMVDSERLGSIPNSLLINNTGVGTLQVNR